MNPVLLITRSHPSYAPGNPASLYYCSQKYCTLVPKFTAFHFPEITVFLFPVYKRKNLIRLGVDQDHAYAWSRTRMGGWAVAQSPILGTTITLDSLRKRGYVAMLTVYEKIAPQLNEPLYMLLNIKCSVNI